MNEQKTGPIKPAGRFFSLRLKIWIGLFLFLLRFLLPAIIGFISTQQTGSFRPLQMIFKRPLMGLLKEWTRRDL